jgi:hypothetical protein
MNNIISCADGTWRGTDVHDENDGGLEQSTEKWPRKSEQRDK